MMPAPVLQLNETTARANLHRMLKKVQQHNIGFWPHFKTHQSAHVGEWFKSAGVVKASVSSLAMAEYFGRHGWNNLHLAMPINVQESTAFKEITERVNLSVQVSHEAHVAFLQQCAKPLDVYIEIDLGQNRSGVQVDDQESIEQLLSAISSHSHLTCQGFYAHNGSTYQASSAVEIRMLHENALAKLAGLKIQFGRQLQVVMGDTPGCSLASCFSEVDVITPGNFIYHDYMQVALGVCSEAEVAVSLLCPVIDIGYSSGKVVVHGGAVHFSKDAITLEGNTIYGKAAYVHKQNGKCLDLTNAHLKSLSQEHGVVSCTLLDLERVDVGDTLQIIPVHSCLAVACMREIQLLTGEKVSTMLS